MKSERPKREGPEGLPRVQDEERGAWLRTTPPRAAPGVPDADRGDRVNRRVIVKTVDMPVLILGQFGAKLVGGFLWSLVLRRILQSKAIA